MLATGVCTILVWIVSPNSCMDRDDVVRLSKKASSNVSWVQSIILQLPKQSVKSVHIR